RYQWAVTSCGHQFYFPSTIYRSYFTIVNPAAILRSRFDPCRAVFTRRGAGYGTENATLHDRSTTSAHPTGPRLRGTQLHDPRTVVRCPPRGAMETWWSNFGGQCDIVMLASSPRGARRYVDSPDERRNPLVHPGTICRS